MKTAKVFAALLLLCSSLLFTNCSTNYDDLATSAQEAMPNGSWNIVYYFKTQDITAKYASCQFKFSNNGVVTCTHDNQSFSGKWSVIIDENRNEVLTIKMDSSSNSLSQLNSDWNVVSINRYDISFKEAKSEGEKGQLRFRKSF